ncbi:MAG: nickel-dependent lactate racemase [Methanocella sp.]
MVKVTLPYGQSELTFELHAENLLTVGSPKEVPGSDVEVALNAGFDNPLGCAALEARVGKGRTVAIISDDYTRPTPVSVLLPGILARLNRAGVSDDDVVVVVAAGIHRPMTPLELEAKLGRETLDRVRVVQHRADDQESLEYLGRTSRGTPVWLNREVVRADFRIGVGMVEAHPYAGFCGGPKIMMPGVAGLETIFHHHGHIAKSPASWFGRTAGNPFWEDLVDVARLGKLDLVVDVVVNGRGEVIDVFVGDPVQAQAAAIKTFIEVYGVEIPELADIVIASANPKYWYFDQSNVSMLNSATVVRPGGTRIIAAACPEGLGPDLIRRLYLESFGRPWPTPAQYLEEMAKGLYNYEMADAPAIYKLLQAEERAHMILVTEGISGEDADLMRLDWSRRIDEALERAFRRTGRDAKVAVLPLAGMCYPYVKGRP